MPKKKDKDWLYKSMQESKKEVDKWPNWQRVAMGLPPIEKPKKKDVIKALAIELHQKWNPGEDPYDDGEDGHPSWKNYIIDAEVAYKFFKKNIGMMT